MRVGGKVREKDREASFKEGGGWIGKEICREVSEQVGLETFGEAGVIVAGMCEGIESGCTSAAERG